MSLQCFSKILSLSDHPSRWFQPNLDLELTQVKACLFKAAFTDLRLAVFRPVFALN